MFVLRLSHFLFIVRRNLFLSFCSDNGLNLFFFKLDYGQVNYNFETHLKPIMDDVFLAPKIITSKNCDAKILKTSLKCKQPPNFRLLIITFNEKKKKLSQRRKLKNHHHMGISCDLNEIITAAEKRSSLIRATTKIYANQIIRLKDIL